MWEGRATLVAEACHRTEEKNVMLETAHSARIPTGRHVERARSAGAPAPAPACPAAAEAVPHGDRTRVSVRGELDWGTARRLRGKLADAVARSGSGVDLDLSGVGFCDCSGLNLLLDLRQDALRQGKTVTVHAAAPAVVRLLDLSGAAPLFAPAGREPRATGPAGDPEPGADPSYTPFPNPLDKDPGSP
ncbi:STAS domain-containing protein [Streptomyces sp. NPDC085946]|uniref:STAS domain-containing protein n=1 Tax=Streptomyces sp. NPDC085946 TaxID=3365744 RepID=UPI0037CFDA9E